jgi:hypothetical protein
VKEVSRWDLMAAMFVICFASPVALSLAWYKLRTGWLHGKFGLDHPTPKAWDHFVRANTEYWVLFHAKNGKTYGGYFGPKSYSSTYPHEQEIYVEEMWRVDERGCFWRRWRARWAASSAPASGSVSSSSESKKEIRAMEHEKKGMSGQPKRLVEGQSGQSGPVTNGQKGQAGVQGQPKTAQSLTPRPPKEG